MNVRSERDGDHFIGEHLYQLRVNDLVGRVREVIEINEREVEICVELGEIDNIGLKGISIREEDVTYLEIAVLSE